MSGECVFSIFLLPLRNVDCAWLLLQKDDRFGVALSARARLCVSFACTMNLCASIDHKMCLNMWAPSSSDAHEIRKTEHTRTPTANQRIFLVVWSSHGKYFSWAVLSVCCVYATRVRFCRVRFRILHTPIRHWNWPQKKRLSFFPLPSSTVA